MSVDESGPRAGGRGPRLGEGEQPPRPQPRYPDWRPAPIPGGPIPTTPSGARTVPSGVAVGSTLSRLAGVGVRVPILYGRLRISPDIVYIEYNTLLPLFRVVISEGPIDAIEEWISPSRVASSTVSLGSLSPTAGLPAWSIGLACASIQTSAGGVWLPDCLARGRKPYDPRLGAWGAGEYPASAYCAYSTNPALIMADLATFPQYGWMRTHEGFDVSAVDWISVAAAADYCDELGSGAKRYEIGGLYIQKGEMAEAWSETIGLHAGLRWRPSAGLWRLEYDSGAASVEATITEDDIPLGSRPTVRFGAGEGLAGLPNRFTAEWTKVTGSTQFSVETVTVQTAEVDAGAAPRDAAVYRLHGFQSEVMAKRALARIRDEVWSEVELDLELPLDFLHLDVGSRFTADLPSLGLVGIDFRVTRCAYDADTVRLSAQLYAATTWDAATEGELAGPAPVGADDPLQGYLPSPPPPAPSAAPTAPAVVAPPPPGLVPVYRRLADPWATGDGLVWDDTEKVAEPGTAGGGGSPLTVEEEDGSPSVVNVTELRFSGATVEEVSAGVARVTVAGGGGSLGQLPVVADPISTAPAGWERTPTGLLVSAGDVVFSSSVIGAHWTQRNPSLIATLDADTTIPDGLYLKGVDNNTGAFTPTSVGSGFVGVDCDSDFELLARVGTTECPDDYRYFVVGFSGQGSYAGTAHGYFHLRTTKFGTDGSPDLSCTPTEAENGIWVLARRIGTTLSFWYSKENVSAPPATWTAINSRTMPSYALRVGIAATRWGGANAFPGGYLRYWRLSAADKSGYLISSAADARRLHATGIASPSQVALLSSLDLGSDSASVDTATLRTAAAAAVNLRAMDDATWEFSAVRSSGAPTPGTYQSAAALTVAGSGRYLGLWARLSSPASNAAGSLDPREIRFRYTPA